MDTDRARYDRQLRVWGDDAQEALERAHVCVVGAGALGAEAAKGLVLPGVGALTLVDGARVGPADIGTNFFVDAAADAGRPRAEAVAPALAALNPRVRVHAVTTAALNDLDDAFWAQFAAVAVTQLDAATTGALAARLERVGVPLVVARSCGLVGMLRVAAPDHAVVDARPATAPADLRVAAPFPELAAHCEGVPDSDLAHAPFVVLLVRALRAWQAQTGRPDALPHSRAEQAALRSALDALARPGTDAANVAEARAHLYCAWTPPVLPAAVRAVLADARCDTPYTDFWVVAAALRAFVAHEGCGALPLAGPLPDMAAETAAYVALQHVYRARAAADVAAVCRHAEAVAARHGRPAPPARLVHRMCRAAATLAVVRYPSAADVGTRGSVPRRGTEPGGADVTPEPQCALAWALLFDAADAVAARAGRWPGDVRDDDAVEDVARTLREDTDALQGAVVARLRALGYAEDAVAREVVAEMVRYGGGEMHCTAAAVGALVAQEVVKLVTHTFVPLDNCAVYNGIAGTVTQYTLPLDSVLE